MKALLLLPCLLMLTNCGTHVGNGLWGGDDGDKRGNPVPNSSGVSPDEAGTETASPSSYVETGPWMGLKISLDALFYQDIPFAEDLLTFLGGRSANWEEKQDEEFTQMMSSVSGEGEQVSILRNENNEIIGSIDTSNQFIYTTEHSVDVSSSTRISNFVFPDEALAGEVRGAYEVTSSSTHYELSWYLTDVNTMMVSIKVTANDGTADDSIANDTVQYRIKKN